MIISDKFRSMFSFIPNMIQRLAFRAARKSPRTKDLKQDNIKLIWNRFRSSIPGGLVRSKCLSLNPVQHLILSVLIIFSCSILDAGYVAIPIGKPQRISPAPGPENPDPILENLEEVMDNHYQRPFYPGGFPDYLSQIILQTNTYSTYLPIIFDPFNDRIMHIQISQNFVYDYQYIFDTTLGTNVIASSIDDGKTWTYGPPVQQIIPLGGTISQIINASTGPGLFLQYAKDGTLFASGQGFMDMVAIPPNKVPLTGFLFTSSDDDGNTWATPKKVYQSSVNWWFSGGPFIPRGVGPREFYTVIDPANNNLIHASTMFPIYPAELFGNIYYFQSNDRGATFSQPRQVYSMVDDPVWQKKHFDAAYTSNPHYFEYGGWSLSSSHPIIVDHNVLVLPFQRNYPKKGSKKYTQSPLNTNFDQAAVRSLDNGKTWLSVAGATEQYIPTNAMHDPALTGSASLFLSTTGQICSPIVSPFTGRLYFTYEAGNPASSSNPLKIQYSPYVVVSASNDKGATWSKTVQINQTPKNIPIDKQQAFGHGCTMTLDGHYVVAYYDIRNWTGHFGENPLKTPLQEDVWLDIYRELDDPNGGSTGIGLDFVEELRVTPHSFDGRIMGIKANYPNNPNFGGGLFVNSTTEGIGMSVNSRNQLFIVFGMNNESKKSNIKRGYKGMTIDTNNRANIFLQRYQFPKPSNE